VQESIAQMNIEFETEKKQNEILKQRAQLAEKDLEVRRKNTFIFGSLGLAFLLGLLGYLLYNQQKLKNRQLQKESELKTALAKIETQNKLQEQRLRISRDLHDNIGAQLTFIISSIDNLKFGFTDMGEKLGNKLSGISAFTQQTIYELRDTIWAMNKESISFEDLQARIANFIEHAKSASENTEFSFNIDENVDENRVFSSVEGMNIYRIIQEAVNNALKYAAAETIEVNIERTDKKLKIEIADNGRGFDENTVQMGNGLNNMKKRAKEIGGQLDVVSIPKKATRVSLLLPIKKATAENRDGLI
jgi:signal transduction histidine kinase